MCLYMHGGWGRRKEGQQQGKNFAQTKQEFEHGQESNSNHILLLIGTVSRSNHASSCSDPHVPGIIHFNIKIALD